LGLILAIQAIPTALGIVAPVVAVAISIVLLAVGIEEAIAALQLPLAIMSIVVTGGIVALIVTLAILELVPALIRRAIGPGIDAQRAVVTIKVTRIGITIRIADAIALLLGASPLVAHGSLLFQIDGIAIVARSRTTIPSWVAGIVDIAPFAFPFTRAQAFVIPQEILTGGSLGTGIR